MEVKIRTLTPIWTGGVEGGKCDRIHETAILGSLRWWMEVLVRGMGGQVSDLTREHHSDFDVRKYQTSTATDERQKLRDAGLCDVSQIFGATGWKRRFRMDIEEGEEVYDAKIKHTIKLENPERNYRDSKGNLKIPTWYFRDPTRKDAKPPLPNTPKTGRFTIHIESLYQGFQPEVISGLIQFIADWSALGARPQMGFGVIQIESDYSDRIDTQPLYNWLVNLSGNKSPSDYKNLPSLQNIFLAQIQHKDSTRPFIEEDTFNLKYDLRQLFRKDDTDEYLRHFIMGTVEKDANKSKNETNKPRPKGKNDTKNTTVKDDRIAAKIKISRCYNNDKLIRVWGWVPEEADADVYKEDGWNRQKVIQNIYEDLKARYTLNIWREMNSGRDTEIPNTSDVNVFLHSLLKL